ncbi:MAG: translocation protein TolB [Candidatus Acidiferrales bacterium]
MKRLIGIVASFIVVIFIAAAPRANAQGVIKTGTGLGVAKVKLAVPKFAARNPQAGPLQDVFHQVLMDDLSYSGIIDMVSPSFYPPNAPSVPGELNAEQWSQAPASAWMVAFGNLTVNGTSLSLAGYLYDVRQTPPLSILEKIYNGDATEAGARQLAHEFADDIISRLSGGLPGIAQTKIAFVSNRSGHKEIWEMDYDGANQHQLTHLGSMALTPRWSPDDSRIAFTCFESYRRVVSAQICMYSTLTNRLMSFPRFPGTNSSPAFSPNGSDVAFMSSHGGDPQIFVTDTTGGHMRRLTYTVGVSTSPTWNPKTGNQIIFVSDRGGLPDLFQMNADGSNVQKIPLSAATGVAAKDLPATGYVIDPAWSPNGELLAFSWRRPQGNYDIYIMDLASHQLAELTRDSGQNERPSWAPDGRHIVFESTRTGSLQIWTMLADGSEPRVLTTTGRNESPNWSLK